MKKIILFELLLLFLGTTFKGDNQQGWYIQPIPVNKSVVDIYFIDTLNGWAVTGNLASMDSSYVLKTTNGGDNWLTNYGIPLNLFAVQFTDINTGYTCGGWGPGIIYKTTNGGMNWSQIYSNGIKMTDLYFQNKDTGWVCDYAPDPFGAGLLKTTNGGLNWTQQLNAAYQPTKMFFLNKDTGWVITNNRVIYRTNNSGNNWFLTSDLNPSGTLYDLFFTSSDTGWMTRYNNNTERILKTTNGGFNWLVQTDPYSPGSAPQNVFMINSKLGYISTAYNKIYKTIDGINWGQQYLAPTGGYNSIMFKDSLNGWSARTFNIAATKDGGGPIMHITNNKEQVAKDFELQQNYPNPFNSMTNVKFKMLNFGYITIKVFDIQGKEISILVNERKPPGEYQVRFEAGDIPSGVYFCSMYVDGVQISIKKMILIK